MRQTLIGHLLCVDVLARETQLGMVTAAVSWAQALCSLCSYLLSPLKLFFRCGTPGPVRPFTSSDFGFFIVIKTIDMTSTVP
jgi:hypothetical protein